MLRVYPDMTATRFRRAMAFSTEAIETMVANLKALGLPD
jgi:hypothetical protein